MSEAGGNRELRRAEGRHQEEMMERVREDVDRNLGRESLEWLRKMDDPEVREFVEAVSAKVASRIDIHENESFTQRLKRCSWLNDRLDELAGADVAEPDEEEGEAFVRDLRREVDGRLDALGLGEPEQHPMERLRTEVAGRFVYYPPRSSAQVEFYRAYRSRVWRVADWLLCELEEPSRELSLALTALEEAVMWGNAAQARHGGDEG